MTDEISNAGIEAWLRSRASEALTGNAGKAYELARERRQMRNASWSYSITPDVELSPNEYPSVVIKD